eukprot:451359-Rhodomonas_salina.1
MGGRSTSQLAADKTGLKFWGEISIIGGGFASFTSQDQSLDLPDSVTGSTPFSVCLLYTSPSPRDRG